eukprot:19412-Eustigmatos_ZCMA.PRE.1
MRTPFNIILRGTSSTFTDTVILPPQLGGLCTVTLVSTLVAESGATVTTPAEVKVSWGLPIGTFDSKTNG